MAVRELEDRVVEGTRRYAREGAQFVTGPAIPRALTCRRSVACAPYDAMVANDAEQVRRRLRELDALGPHFNDAARDWTDAVKATLIRVLPAGHPTHERFSQILWGPVVISDATDVDWVTAFDHGRRSAVELLNRLLQEIAEIHEDGPPETAGAVLLTAAEVGRLEDVTRRLRAAIDDGHLDVLAGDDRRELDAELATLEAQQRSSRPKRSIVKLALTTVCSLLVGVASGVLGNEVTPVVNDLLQRL